MKSYYLLAILVLFFCIDVNARRRGVDDARKNRNMERASKEAERRAKASRRKAEEAKKRAEQQKILKAQQERRRKAQESAKRSSDESARKYLELQRLKKEKAARNPKRTPTRREPVIIAQTLPTEFKDQTKAEIQPYIKSIISPYHIAQKLKLDFPPKEPTEDLETVKKTIDALVLGKLDEAFPPSTKDIHYKKALEKYYLYEKSEKVEGLRIRPTGRNAVLSGTFQGLSRQGRLVIGSYEVPKVDMTEGVMVHFDEALNDKKIETYMANKLFYYYEDRAELKEKLLSELQNPPLNKAGYYEMKGSYYNGTEYIKAVYENESTKIVEHVYEIVKERLFVKYDFKSSSLNNEEVLTDLKQYVFEEVSKLKKIENTSLFSPDFYK